MFVRNRRHNLLDPTLRSRLRINFYAKRLQNCENASLGQLLRRR